MRKVWPFSVSFLLFASGACAFPFFVLYYQSLGFTGTQIGLITGLTPLITLVSAPLWTNLADASRRHRLVMSLLILVAAGLLFAFPLFQTFGPVILMVVLYNLFASPVMSFADNAAMATLAGEKALYGRVRLGGTIGFGLAALLAGVLVQNYGLRWAFWTASVLQLLALAAAQPLTHQRVKTGTSQPGSVATLLADRRWLPFLMLAFAAGLSMVATNSYLFPFLRELGASESTMGLALTIATIAEVPVFFFGDRLVRRFKPFGLLVLAMLLVGARLVLFVFSASPNFVLFLQVFGGLTFPALWLAGVAYADELAPPGLGATAQGLFSATVFGFGSAVGGFLAGPLLANLGGRGMFLVFGLLILAIVGVVALFQKQLRAGPPEIVPG